MDEWINLSGCNSCINTLACKIQKNCVILNINIIYPIYNKKRQKFIQKLKWVGNDTELVIKLLYSIQPKEKELPKINLTQFEKLCIKNIKYNGNTSGF